MLAEVKEKTATPITQAAENRAKFPLLRLKGKRHPDTADPISPVSPPRRAAGTSSCGARSRRLAGGLHRLHDLQPTAIRAALRRQGERGTVPAPHCLPACLHMPACRAALGSHAPSPRVQVANPSELLLFQRKAKKEDKADKKKEGTQNADPERDQDKDPAVQIQAVLAGPRVALVSRRRPLLLPHATAG